MLKILAMRRDAGHAVEPPTGVGGRLQSARDPREAQFMKGFLFERLRLPAQGKDDSGAQRFSVIWLSDYQL
jgi:hypothetical protein